MATMTRNAVDLASSIENSCVPAVACLDLNPETEQPRTTETTLRRSKIHYAIEFKNPQNGTVIKKEPVASFGQATHGLGDEDAVFEVVASYQTKGSAPSNTMQPSTLSKPKYYMNIYSPSIINALRSVVKYYPDQDLSGDSIVVAWPYCVIVHHYEKLAEYRDACMAKPLTERCIRDQDSEEHINIMLEYLDEHIMPNVRAEQDRVKRGVYTWENFWATYKPGNLIMFPQADGRWGSGILGSVTGGIFTNRPRAWDLTFWNLAYNGDSVDRVTRTVEYAMFDGEWDMGGALTWDATQELTESDIRALGPQLVKKYDHGKRYWELLRKQCKYYKGKTGTFPHNEIDGLVMADLKAYYQEYHQEAPNFRSRSDLRDWASDCVCNVCQRRKSAPNEPVPGQQPTEALFYDCTDIMLETVDELEPMQYVLLPDEIRSFVFSTRSWELLHVDLFSEPEFPEDMIGNLVMDQQRKKTLKALSKSFVRRNKREEELARDMWSADFVKGKGGGLIFLLHGKPGVGKTCTAECIAAFTKRPLMTLTASDIGTDASEIETKLSREFKTAKSWGAILLIDEADVFMENRSSRDLHRNSLVAGFLRALEYYDGILFLTTNRVGTFDDAFISRVHVQMYYPDFTDAQRQEVWMTFVDRLTHERGDYMRLTIDAKEYLRSQGVKAMKWNGREIRNTFQTAIALAEYDSEKGEDGLIKVTDEHFRPVIELSRDFKEYLDSLHKANEAKRAQVKKERLDSFVKDEGNDS